MPTYQGSTVVKRRPKDGEQGIQGPLMVQKEWVVGDTHRFNDEIKDFIYVRGASSDTSYWYTRTSKGDDIVAGAAPVGGANVEGYTRVDWLRTLAVNVLLAEEANLANFIFKDGKLISVRGTVNGAAVDYAGQAGFMPSIVIDGKTGNITVQNNTIGGSVWTGNLSPNGLIFEVSYINGTYSPKKIWIAGSGAIIITDQSNPNENESTHIRSSSITVQQGSNQTVIKPDGVYINGQKLTGGSDYVLPVATPTTLGGIKVGSRLTISSGVLSANVQSDNNFTSAYKNKLDGIASGANNYTHPTTHSADMITAGTFQGIVKANNNTSYTTKQVRNIILSTGDAVSSQMANGDIWIKYE